jgi:uncharacterized cupin superfamily protein
MYKPYICKMYISVHNLNIETGRVCSMCNLNVVEDEYHYILQCEKIYWCKKKYTELSYIS